jgi:MFS family permease
MVSAWFRTTFQSLSNPQYRTLWMGTTVAFLAFMMSMIVQSIVAFDLTGKNGSVGIVALGMGIASITISPFGGVIADRVSKRRLLLIGQVVVGINFLLVGVLVVSDAITIWMLALSTFVMGAVFAFIGPARQAWIGEIVEGPELGNAIAMQQVGMTSTRVVGPLLVAAFVAIPFIGTGGTYLVMSAFFAYVIFTLTQLPATQARPSGGKSILGDFKMGYTHIASRPRLALLVTSFMGVIMFGFSYQVVLPGLLENELGREAEDMGLLFFAGAISGLVITLAVASKASGHTAWRIMILGGFVLGISLAITAFSQNFWQAMGMMFIAGAGSSAFQLLNNSLIMQEADQAYHGRVMSLTMLAWGLNGLVGYPFGLLADGIGERQTIFIMAAGVISVTLLMSVLYAALRGREPAGAQPLPTPAGGD